MKFDKHYPILRRFLLESRFEDETELSLYQMFKEKHPDYDLAFDEFRTVISHFMHGLILFSLSSSSVSVKLSSRDTLVPIWETEANMIRQVHQDEEFRCNLSAALDGERIDWRYEGAGESDLYRAYLNSEDYVIYRVDSRDSDADKTVSYKITAEELAKQVEETRKEIESCGKTVYDL